MTEKIIPAMEARTHLGDIMKRSVLKGVSFIVEKAGIPMVVIMDVKNYEQYKQLMEERNQDFEVIDAIRSKLPNISEEDVKSLVNDSIKSIRKDKNA